MMKASNDRCLWKGYKRIQNALCSGVDNRFYMSKIPDWHVVKWHTPSQQQRKMYEGKVKEDGSSYLGPCINRDGQAVQLHGTLYHGLVIERVAQIANKPRHRFEDFAATYMKSQASSLGIRSVLLRIDRIVGGRYRNNGRRASPSQLLSNCCAMFELNSPVSAAASTSNASSSFFLLVMLSSCK